MLKNPDQPGIKARLEECILLLNDPGAAQVALDLIKHEFSQEFSKDDYLYAGYLEAARIVALSDCDLVGGLKYAEQLLKLSSNSAVSAFTVCVAAVDFIRITRRNNHPPNQALTFLESNLVLTRAGACSWGVDILEELLNWDLQLAAQPSIIVFVTDLCKQAGIESLDPSLATVKVLKHKLLNKGGDPNNY